ncbi:hypothetical protein BHJ80_25930 (plasmid) [Escherichia coli]|nr:hypothetical protein BHJ80_25930 [Escherichia coli]
MMCPEYFFLMLFFCGYRACYCSSSSSSFRSSPLLFIWLSGRYSGLAIVNRPAAVSRQRSNCCQRLCAAATPP